MRHNFYQARRRRSLWQKLLLCLFWLSLFILGVTAGGIAVYIAMTGGPHFPQPPEMEIDWSLVQKVLGVASGIYAIFLIALILRRVRAYDSSHSARFFWMIVRILFSLLALGAFGWLLQELSPIQLGVMGHSVLIYAELTPNGYEIITFPQFDLVGFMSKGITFFNPTHMNPWLFWTSFGPALFIMVRTIMMLVKIEETRPIPQNDPPIPERKERRFSFFRKKS